jgi:hypothetical protein
MPQSVTRDRATHPARYPAGTDRMIHSGTVHLRGRAGLTSKLAHGNLPPADREGTCYEGVRETVVRTARALKGLV